MQIHISTPLSIIYTYITSQRSVLAPYKPIFLHDWSLIRTWKFWINLRKVLIPKMPLQERSTYKLVSRHYIWITQEHRRIECHLCKEIALARSLSECKECLYCFGEFLDYLASRRERFEDLPDPLGIPIDSNNGSPDIIISPRLITFSFGLYRLRRNWNKKGSNKLY